MIFLKEREEKYEEEETTTIIYQYIIKDNKTGYPEVFRTVHKGYIPEGYTLEAELSTFTIEEELPYGRQEKPRKTSFWERLFG